MLDSKEVQRKFYNRHFDGERFWSDSEISENTKYFTNRFIDCILKPESKKVLEIGCGNGLLTFFLLKKQLEITAVDISRKAIESMKKQFFREINQGKLKLECSDANDFLEGTNEKFDAIVGSGIVHHIEKREWGNLFGSAYGRLNPGGVFACGPEPNAGGLYAFAWPFAKFFYRLFGMDYDWEVEKGTLDMIPKNLLLALEKAGFHEVKIVPFQVMPHFRLKILEYVDKKLIKYVMGKYSMYIIVKAEKKFDADQALI